MFLALSGWGGTVWVGWQYDGVVAEHAGFTSGGVGQLSATPCAQAAVIYSHLGYAEHDFIWRTVDCKTDAWAFLEPKQR